jgi:hypothetical protein
MAAFIDTLEVAEAGKVGHIAASSAGYQGRTLTRVVDANVNSGLAVCNGTLPGKSVKQPTTAAEAAACKGILLDPEYVNEIGAAAEYLAGDQAAVLEEGYVWVNSEGTVAVDDPVYVRHTSDGGSNTTRGTLSNNSGGTLVIDTTANAIEGLYTIELFNGVVNEKFFYQTDGSATTAEILAGLVAAIQASANYDAAGTTEITVTLVAGSEITLVELTAPTGPAQALWTVTDNQKCTRLKGARFASARTGAGRVKVRLDLPV